MFKRELQIGHPFLNLPDNNLEKFVLNNLTCQVRTNSTPQDKLFSDAKFCSQKLVEFAIELDSKASVDNSLVLSYRNGKLISCLKGLFGKKHVEFEGLAKLTDVKPYIEKYIGEVYERKKQWVNKQQTANGSAKKRGK